MTKFNHGCGWCSILGKRTQLRPVNIKMFRDPTPMFHGQYSKVGSQEVITKLMRCISDIIILLWNLMFTALMLMKATSFLVLHFNWNTFKILRAIYLNCQPSCKTRPNGSFQLQTQPGRVILFTLPNLQPNRGRHGDSVIFYAGCSSSSFGRTTHRFTKAADLVRRLGFASSSLVSNMQKGSLPNPRVF